MVHFGPNLLSTTGLSDLYVLLGLGWITAQVGAKGTTGFQPVRLSEDISHPSSQSTSVMLLSEPALETECCSRPLISMRHK